LLGILYGCHIKEATRAEDFENRVLRKTFGFKRDEVRGEDSITRSFMMCTHPKYYLSNQIEKTNEMGGSCSKYGEERCEWWGKLMERAHLERPRLRCEYNIKMDLEAVRWGCGLD
jgi:hypothetical protein